MLDAAMDRMPESRTPRARSLLATVVTTAGLSASSRRPALRRRDVS